MGVAGGVAMVSGALVGGALLASFAFWVQIAPASLEGTVENIVLLAPGLIGINLGRNPNGIVNEVTRQYRRTREALRERRERLPVAEIPPAADLETLGVDRPFTVDDLEVIDAGSRRRDASRHLEAGGDGPAHLLPRRRVEAHPDHHVGVVDAAGPHVDDDLPGPGSDAPDSMPTPLRAAVQSPWAPQCPGNRTTENQNCSMPLTVKGGDELDIEKIEYAADDDKGES